MFRPNVRGLHYQRSRRSSAFGQAMYEEPTKILLGIVKLEVKSTPTSVRADASASRGAADQHTAQAKFLIPVKYRIGIGDVIEVDNTKVEVMGIHYRHSVRGTHDHNEVTGMIKGDFPE